MEENDHGVQHMAKRGILSPNHKCLFPNKDWIGGITRVILKAGSKKHPSHEGLHLQLLSLDDNNAHRVLDEICNFPGMVNWLSQ